MRRPHPTPRLVAAAAAAVVCSAALLVPAPAQAAALVAIGSVGVEAHADAACTGVADDFDGDTLTSTGSTSRDVAADGSISDPGDVADTSSWSGSGSMTLTATTGGGAPAITMTGELDMAVDAAQDDASACDARVDGDISMLSVITFDKAGWLAVDVTGLPVAAATTSVVVGDVETGKTLIHQTIGQSGFRGSVWVEAGQYQAAAGVQVRVDDDSATDEPTSAGGKAAFSFRYVAPGAAAGPAKGSGTSFVSTGNGVNCTDHQLVASFTKKASGLKSAVFTVNGKKQTFKNPSPGQVVLFGTGSSTADTVVKAKLTPTSGKARTVSRTYLACA